MDYKSLMGYGKKKKVVKEQPKPKKESVVDDIKKELNEWTDTAFKTMPKRWSAASDKGLTEHEKELQEGPAYEYGKHIKNIQKAQNMMEKSVLALKKDLLKKGHKQEGVIISAGFYQFAEDKFNKVLKSIMDTLS